MQRSRLSEHAGQEGRSELHLLELAGVPPSDEAAAAWLSNALEAVRPHPLAERRPAAADRNALLEGVQKSAQTLIKRMEQLRRQPICWYAFWHSPEFGPVLGNRVELPSVFFFLETIGRAAESAKDPRKGRPTKTNKQDIVDMALAFFARFSPKRPSGTPTGEFATFARAFYASATGDRSDELDRQIRQAVKRLPVERERAQQNSGEKSRVPS
jgi:hypothetical protein